MTDERRQFYRIDDQVSLWLERIEAAQIDARLKDFWENEQLYSIRNNHNFQIERQIADFQKIATDRFQAGDICASG
jgi:hypothetical protein